MRRPHQAGLPGSSGSLALPRKAACAGPPAGRVEAARSAAPAVRAPGRARFHSDSLRVSERSERSERSEFRSGTAGVSIAAESGPQAPAAESRPAGGPAHAALRAPLPVAGHRSTRVVPRPLQPACARHAGDSRRGPPPVNPASGDRHRPDPRPCRCSPGRRRKLRRWRSGWRRAGSRSGSRCRGSRCKSTARSGRRSWGSPEWLKGAGSGGSVKAILVSEWPADLNEAADFALDAWHPLSSPES